MNSTAVAQPVGAKAAIGWIGAALVTAVAVAGVLPVASQWPVITTAAVLTSTAWASTGAVLAAVPGQGVNAALFQLVGLFWAISWLDNHEAGPFPALAYLAGPAQLVAAATVLLRYPHSRLEPWSRVYVLVAAGWLLPLRLLTMLFSEPERLQHDARVWWPTIAHDDRAYHVLSDLFWFGSAILLPLFVVVLTRHLWRAARIDRRMLAPLIVAAAGAAVTVIIRVPLRIVAPSVTTPMVLVALESAGLLCIPLAFLWSAVNRRLARGTIADLVVALARLRTPVEIRGLLRATLHDPRLEILYRSPGLDGLVSSTGSPADAPDPDRNVLVDVHGHDGSLLATVVADRALERYRPLLDAAVSASGMAIENARLQAVAEGQMREVHEIRSLLAGAGPAERRRIERDLHDGVQQRLLALAMRLEVVRQSTREPAVRTIVDQTHEEVRASLAELRRLAHGIRPSALDADGLRAAVLDLAARMPVPVRVDVPPRRWPPAAEETAYFVVCEALANVLKHAEAGTATVVVTDRGERLGVEVGDDGRGGADLRAGTGLTGLAARVEATGGTLTVRSPPGGGTLIVAEVAWT
ncbi:sensor histidine kinase [Paractinoplanes brasiliensis]|uniref:sensor histidine kinase n=1 Tax=Paractinoplanes brasiliensis TaxID=52695 RepID=UPI00141523B6|nr:histidine kinase [Actinoplanes brasiliensis]